MQVNPINSPASDFKVALQQPAEKSVDSQPKQQPAVSTEEKPEQSEKLAKLQNVLAESNITLNFSRDEGTNELVVKIVDSSTGEAIRQFPSEVSLKLSAINTKLQGQFIDKKG